jgi:hypothetical protein
MSETFFYEGYSIEWLGIQPRPEPTGHTARVFYCHL